MAIYCSALFERKTFRLRLVGPTLNTTFSVGSYLYCLFIYHHLFKAICYCISIIINICLSSPGKKVDFVVRHIVASGISNTLSLSYFESMY